MIRLAPTEARGWMRGAMTQGGRGAAEFTHAYLRLRQDPSFQFAFVTAPAPHAPPGWLLSALKSIGQALAVAAPVLRIAVWCILGAAILALVAVLLRQSGGRRARKAEAGIQLQALGLASQAAARAVARLADADALATGGAYGAAVHLLLLSGVDEIERVQPRRIQPSYTSRDIAALSELPGEPRSAFSQIAAVVERALFGGRPIDFAAWQGCRDAFLALTRTEAWRTAADGAAP